MLCDVEGKGMTALHLAAVYDYPDTIRELIACKANVNEPTYTMHAEWVILCEGNMRALHFAARQINISAIQVLLEHGADMQPLHRSFPILQPFSMDYWDRLMHDRSMDYWDRLMHDRWDRFRSFSNSHGDIVTEPRHVARSVKRKMQAAEIMLDSPQGKKWLRTCDVESFNQRLPQRVLVIMQKKKQMLSVGGSA